MDNYSNFQLFGLNTQEYITGRSYNKLDCVLAAPSAGVEYLDCQVLTSFWPLTVLQTCPLYDEYFDTPLVIGEEWSETSPDCFRKRIKLVRACAKKP